MQQTAHQCECKTEGVGRFFVCLFKFFDESVDGRVLALEGLERLAAFVVHTDAAPLAEHVELCTLLQASKKRCEHANNATFLMTATL